jgi:hypothetical protein
MFGSNGRYGPERLARAGLPWFCAQVPRKDVLTHFPDHQQPPVDPARDDQRLLPDRRQDPTPAISRFTLRGRRARIRREFDLLRGRYVDRSSGAHLALILTLLILVTVDTASTLFILEHGGRELNPLMDRALRRGVGWFLLFKLGPLPLAFLLLSIHRYYRWVRATLGLLVVVYGGLALYHLYLLGRVLQHLSRQ